MKDALASVDGLLAELGDEFGQIGAILSVSFPRVVQVLCGAEARRQRVGKILTRQRFRHR